MGGGKGDENVFGLVPRSEVDPALLFLALGPT